MFPVLSSGLEFLLCVTLTLACRKLYDDVYTHMIIVIVFYSTLLFLHYRLVELVITRLFVIMT